MNVISCWRTSRWSNYIIESSYCCALEQDSASNGQSDVLNDGCGLQKVIQSRTNFVHCMCLYPRSCLGSCAIESSIIIVIIIIHLAQQLFSERCSMGPLLLSFFSEKKRGVGEGETLSGDCGLYCLHGQSSVLEPALVATCVGAGGRLQSPPHPPPTPQKKEEVKVWFTVHLFIARPFWVGRGVELINTAVFLTVCAHALRCLLRMITLQGTVKDVCT